MARREACDRHRQLLRRFDALPPTHGLDAHRELAQWARTDARLLPRAARSLHRSGTRNESMTNASARRVVFNALRPAGDAEAVAAAIKRVVDSGWYILGPEVEAFESEFAYACHASYAVSVGNGTDAIALMLRALDIGPGDEVIT